MYRLTVWLASVKSVFFPDFLPVQQLLEALKKQNELYKQVLAGLAPIAEKRKVEYAERLSERRLKGSSATYICLSLLPSFLRMLEECRDLIIVSIHNNLRKDGVYEARFHRQGIHIEVSSKDLTKLKQKLVCCFKYPYSDLYFGFTPRPYS